MALWDRITSRGKVEDRRGMAPVVGGIGVGGIAIYLLFTLLTGQDVDVGEVLNQLETLETTQQQDVYDPSFEGSDEYEVFASTVLGSNNDMWQKVFSDINKTYNPPKLVLFRTATQSGCGNATSQVGPHYCPLDKTIYLDETFFDELQKRFGARGGDVAEAYVIAHEVGHHAQSELGILEAAQQNQESAIRLELQADCFAGMWINSIKHLNVLEPGEVYEAMDAAAAVGDDRIQESVTGRITPETWTHGSSQQRMESFNRGYDTGDFSQCNTI